MTVANQPLVSVGIPTYNRPEYLRTVLDCFRAQSFEDFEVIISDNASPNPEVQSVAEEFVAQDRRFRYIRQKSNIGPVANFWFVYDEGLAPYFMWAADDDIWSPNFIERGLGALEINKTASAWFCQVVNIDERGDTVRTYPSFSRFSSTKSKVWDLAKYAFEPEVMGKANLIYSIFRRDALRPIEQRFRCEPLTWGVDMAWVYAFLCRANIVIDDDVFLYKRVPPGTECDPDKLRNVVIAREHLREYLSAYSKAARASQHDLSTSAILALRFCHDYVLNKRWRDDLGRSWKGIRDTFRGDRPS